MIVAATGHRPSKLSNDYYLKSDQTKAIKGKIIEILADGQVDTMISGMALGIDTLFAEIALELRIPLICAIPFKGQELKWNDRLQAGYHSILQASNQVVLCDFFHPLIRTYKEYLEQPMGAYEASKMQHRNEWMVDRCNKLIAVWDGSKGGTYNCLVYAAMKNRSLIAFDPNTLAIRHEIA